MFSRFRSCPPSEMLNLFCVFLLLVFWPVNYLDDSGPGEALHHLFYGIRPSFCLLGISLGRPGADALLRWLVGYHMAQLLPRSTQKPQPSVGIFDPMPGVLYLYPHSERDVQLYLPARHFPILNSIPHFVNSFSLEINGCAPVFMTMNDPGRIDFSSSALIKGRSVICKLSDAFS